MKNIFIMLATILVVNTSIKSQQIKFEPIWSNSKSINDNWLYLEKDSEDLPIEKDIEYLTNLSFLNDMNIIYHTLIKIVKKEGIQVDQTADDMIALDILRMRVKN